MPGFTYARKGGNVLVAYKPNASAQIGVKKSTDSQAKFYPQSGGAGATIPEDSLNTGDTYVIGAYADTSSGPIDTDYYVARPGSKVMLTGKAAGLDGYPDYAALTDSQKKPLADWVSGGTGPAPRMKDAAGRLGDAKDVATLMNAGGSAVADVFADEITKKPLIVTQLSRLSDWFTNCTWNGSPASGQQKSDTQSMLVRIMALLIGHAYGSGTASTIINNTVEHFLGGLPLALGDAAGAKEALAQFGDNKVSVCVSGLLRITPAGIGDAEETLKKLCHEVNHACRASLTDETSSPAGWMVDEFWAYTVELLAAGQTITQQQCNSTFEILRNPPYNLGSTVDGAAGKAFQDALKYNDDQWSTFIVSSLPSPSAAKGWNLTNALE